MFTSFVLSSTLRILTLETQKRTKIKNNQKQTTNKQKKKKNKKNKRYLKLRLSGAVYREREKGDILDVTGYLMFSYSLKRHAFKFSVRSLLAGRYAETGDINKLKIDL